MAWRLPVFFVRHPQALVNLAPELPALQPIANYATCPYFAIHAYRFIDAKGGSRYVRYTLVPEAAEQRLSLREARRRGRDYLQEEIRQRVAREPVRFTLKLQVAGPGDTESVRRRMA